jgi:hypothetical protein
MALWPAIVAITAITALFIAGLVFALYRWLTAKEFPKKPVRQALILGTCVLTAVLADERLLRISPVPPGCDALYKMNYAVKWEVLALIATAIISKLYLEAELEGQGKVEARYVTKAVTLINYALPCLVIASVLLIGMLWADSRTWRLIFFGLHFVLVWAVSLLFLKADKAIWTGVIPKEDPKHDLKDITRLTYCLADWPVFLSLTLLGIFVVLHWSEHSLFHRLEQGPMPFLRILLHHSPKETDPVNMWVSEEYFMSGAIAFQYLMSTTIYVILALGLVGIHGPKRQLELE